MNLVITQAAVKLDGRRVADLRWSGKAVTLVAMDGRRYGRIMPHGYAAGRIPVEGEDCFDAWTAKHPAVHVPSDTTVAEGLTMAKCVAILIGEDR